MFPTELAQLQPNGYTCGPAALRHALLCYGVRKSVKSLAALCGTTKEGTNTRQLQYAANALGFQLREFQYRKAAEAVHELIEYLPVTPCLLCVDRGPDGPWAHWIVCIRATLTVAMIADSARPGPVVQLMRWKNLMRRLAVFEAEGVNTYDIYPLLERDDQ